MRCLLKVSGEVLFQNDGSKKLLSILNELLQKDIEIGLVIGGGNIMRGINATSGDRVISDQIGMIATIINALAFKKELGSKAIVMSAIDCEFVEKYSWQKALNYLKSGQIVIFCGGTGHPYFSTDTAAALRAIEIGADLLVKATKVDGVFDKDPKKEAGAKKFDTISYEEYLSRGLKVMDMTAVALCKENKMPIRISLQDSIKQAILEGKIGTLIGG